MLLDWPRFLDDHRGARAWPFVVVDYYRQHQRSASSHLVAVSPDEFLSRLIPSLRQSKASLAQLHDGLLAAGAQLMGIDLQRLIPLSEQLLVGRRLEPDEAEAVTQQYSAYGLEIPSSSETLRDVLSNHSQLSQPASSEALSGARRSKNHEGTPMRNPLTACVLTALPREFEALRTLLPNMEPLDAPSGVGRQFVVQHRGQRVILASTTTPGPLAAAIATTQLLERHSPDLIILVGIAGGFRSGEDYKLGDVAFASQIVDYEGGKLRSGGNERRFEVFRSSDYLLSAAHNAAREPWTNLISADLPDGRAKTTTTVHFGVVGSGAKVIADEQARDDLRSFWPRMIAVEMEGAGLALAAHRASYGVHLGLVKGIADWADGNKNDDWHVYASIAAAAFTLALIESASSQNPQALASPPPDEIVRRAHIKYESRALQAFSERLGDSWNDLVLVLDVPNHIQNRWPPGLEGNRLIQYLKERNQLYKLEPGLQQINRDDLADELAVSRTIRAD
jgi:adenosylhomocysteine nucleosidase